MGRVKDRSGQDTNTKKNTTSRWPPWPLITLEQMKEMEIQKKTAQNFDPKAFENAINIKSPEKAPETSENTSFRENKQSKKLGNSQVKKKNEEAVYDADGDELRLSDFNVDVSDDNSWFAPTKAKRVPSKSDMPLDTKTQNTPFLDKEVMKNKRQLFQTEDEVVISDHSGARASEVEEDSINFIEPECVTPKEPCVHNSLMPNKPSMQRLDQTDNQTPTENDTRNIETVADLEDNGNESGEDIFDEEVVMGSHNIMKEISANVSMAKEPALSTTEDYDYEDTIVKNKSSKKKKEKLVNKKDKTGLTSTIEAESIHNMCDWAIVLPESHQTVTLEGKIRGKEEKGWWPSTAISERVARNTLRTVTGDVYLLEGKIDEDVCIKQGYSSAMVKAFKKGFPKNWKDWVKWHFANTKKTDCKAGQKEVDTDDEKQKPTLAPKKSKTLTLKAESSVQCDSGTPGSEIVIRKKVVGKSRKHSVIPDTSENTDVKVNKSTDSLTRIDKDKNSIDETSPLEEDRETTNQNEDDNMFSDGQSSMVFKLVSKSPVELPTCISLHSENSDTEGSQKTSFSSKKKIKQFSRVQTRSRLKKRTQSQPQPPANKRRSTAKRPDKNESEVSGYCEPMASSSATVKRRHSIAAVQNDTEKSDPKTLPKSVHKERTQKQPETAHISSKVKEKTKITGGRGTMKRTRQLRELVREAAKEKCAQDTFFNTTPGRATQTFKFTFDTDHSADNENADEEEMNTPKRKDSTSQHNEPILEPVSTPFPGISRKKRDNDLYVYMTEQNNKQKSKGNKVLSQANKSKQLLMKKTAKEQQKSTMLVASDMFDVYAVNKENNNDSQDEEDHYFSSDNE